MTGRPGITLRRVAAQLLPPATVERFIDPAVADLQHEYFEALTHTRWPARAIRITGTLRLLQVIALLSGQYGLQRGWDRLSHPYAATNVMTDRTMATVGSLTAPLAIGMTMAVSAMAIRYRTYPGAELQIVAFALLAAFGAGAIQFGFAMALLSAATRRTTARRLKIAGLLSMSVLFSAASVRIIGATLPLPSHLAAVGAFIQPEDARSMLFAYGTRIAAGLAPLLLCVFALALARRYRVAVAFPAAVAVLVAYVVWFTWLRQPLIASSLPVALAVWAPDAAIILSTLLVAFAYTGRNTGQACAQ